MINFVKFTIEPIAELTIRFIAKFIVKFTVEPIRSYIELFILTDKHVAFQTIV